MAHCANAWARLAVTRALMLGRATFPRLLHERLVALRGQVELMLGRATFPRLLLRAGPGGFMTKS